MNFALLRPATQSSTYQDFVASKAVDGNAVDDSSCAITGAHDYKPWWKAQLAYPVWVTHVDITNRKYGARYKHFCKYHVQDGFALTKQQCFKKTFFSVN